ncbi:universal stress protein [Paractinoplanes atraurantiacus]|uniref:Nucleotide-binding universal stress protein, UspA family n=1 Tax=Paractinoplanes atraurantiacus TaxID=1036182 RepID=A0A285JJ46_9ACTN|nr:universal stress protein [Actinoplanes atraurantiacus]SNY59121.1 Nucleotide-binding universal stress protein, UspA family [Actinoplanes atraurantiacus]
MNAAAVPVVAGVDGSERGSAAVLAAADAAVRRGRPLRVVHALVYVPAGVTMSPSIAPPAYPAYLAQAEYLVAHAAGLARRRAPGLSVTSAVVPGGAAAVLVDESRRADLLVIGDHGVSAAAELVIGSVAAQTAAHSACPVLIVRGAPHPEGAVVVGVDGSAGSQGALVFAAEEASRRDADLVAVHTWNDGDGTELNAELPMTYETWSGDEEQKRVLAEALAGLAQKFPDLRVRSLVRRGFARRVLTEHSRTAQLLVVGSRGHGGFTGLLLGSVGRHLAHHADCPVAIVRTQPPPHSVS